MLAVLAINKRTGKMEREPEMVMRGFGGADITEQAREVVLKTLDGLTGEEKADYGMVKEKVRVELKRLIQKTTRARTIDHAGNSGDMSAGSTDNAVFCHYACAGRRLGSSS